MKNRVATANRKNEIISIEDFSTPEAAYDYYKDSIRILKKHLPKGETVTVIRFREGAIMAMETVVGTH